MRPLKRVPESMSEPRMPQVRAVPPAPWTASARTENTAPRSWATVTLPDQELSAFQLVNTPA